MTAYRIFSVGVDFKDTPLETREKFAFDDERAKALIKEICEREVIKGCCILSTCCRSEIYISSQKDGEWEELFLKAGGVRSNDFSGKINVYRDMEAISHLMETACGINSAIKGESQIISQISHSADLSRGLGLMGAELDVLFRTAVKTARGAVSDGAEDGRVTSAYKACEMLERELGGLMGKKCLVIGNGNVGLLAARLLEEKGADVTITLRSYKHGESIVPRGVGCIPYSDRLKAAPNSDVIISATKSPHFTLTKAMTEGISLPGYIIDLAVPADIEPAVYKNKAIKYYNIDDFISEDILSPKVYDSVEKGIGEYMSWYNYREALDTIRKIKITLSGRIAATGDFDETVCEAISGKAADILLGSLKEIITPDVLEKALCKIKERARL